MAWGALGAWALAALMGCDGGDGGMTDDDAGPPVVGTDVETSIFDVDSYCGGYSLNLGLEITQAWLDNCSDGFLNCSSQNGAGRVWFYDTSRMAGGEPLSHNQSRRKCFGLDTVLRNDL